MARRPTAATTRAAPAQVENGYNYNFWRAVGATTLTTEQPKAQLDVTGDTIVSGTLTAGVFVSAARILPREQPDTYGLLCTSPAATTRTNEVVSSANSPRVTELQDAQYLEIWVGTFPELVIKQDARVELPADLVKTTRRRRPPRQAAL